MDGAHNQVSATERTQSYMAPVTDLMLDLETTGVRPDRNAILQIAIVPFNLHERVVYEDHCFDRCMVVPPSRHWDLSTLSFWNGSNVDVYNSICARSEQYHLVISQLVQFLNHYKNISRIWGLRAFDWPFLESYLHDLGYKNPIKYTKFREIETALDAVNCFQGGYQQYRVRPPKGQGHDAYVDCLFQIQTLFNGVTAHVGNTRNPQQ